jgi:hypothetical protein
MNSIQKLALIQIPTMTERRALVAFLIAAAISVPLFAVAALLAVLITSRTRARRAGRLTAGPGGIVPRSANPSLNGITYCYKNREATEHSLRLFKKHYPESKIAIASDGGYDYSYLARELGAYYEHGRNLNVSWSTAEDAVEWIARFARGMEAVGYGYVMIVEDDVETRGRLTLQPAAGVWGGPQFNLLSTAMSKWILANRKSGPKLDTVNGRLRYSGCGGCVLDGNLWKEKFDLEEVKGWIEQMFDLDPAPNEPDPAKKRRIHTDILVCFLYYMWGSTVSPSGEWTEPIYDDWKDPKYKVVHSFKKYYPKK